MTYNDRIWSRFVQIASYFRSVKMKIKTNCFHVFVLFKLTFEHFEIRQFRVLQCHKKSQYGMPKIFWLYSNRID